MIKRIGLICIIFFLLIFFFSSATFALSPTPVSTTPVTLSNQKVIYDLPYPGLLPDHPLYFIKRIRDTLEVYLTSDPVQKIELRLLLADKQLSMAVALAQKGKQTLAGKTFLQSEEQFARVPQLRRQYPDAHVSPDLSSKIKQSNAKHKEIIETTLKKGLITESQAQEALSKNTENEKEIEGK